ncbi:MAG: hypothetical protein K8823_1320 [Cenarchaeum symbiont of Oopsacas minuta]|nr:hypothetical protein [Cenarchaeum symbiont of Oopsacas minuta]
MENLNADEISDILFDPEISAILELLENGPIDESKICDKLSITTKDLTDKLSPLVENGFVIKSDVQYSVDAKKLANVLESNGQFDGVMDKVTQMDSYLN